MSSFILRISSALLSMAEHTFFLSATLSTDFSSS
jgi:hypothetical protein